MSSTLHWRPINHNGEPFADALKFHLRDRIYGGIISDWTEVGADLVPFLEGVITATQSASLRAEAEHLIALIQQHGSVEIREVY